MESIFIYGKDHLTASKALEIAKGTCQGVLDPSVRESVLASQADVQTIVDSGDTVYGINTGFGPLCTTKI